MDPCRPVFAPNFGPTCRVLEHLVQFWVRRRDRLLDLPLHLWILAAFDSGLELSRPVMVYHPLAYREPACLRQAGPTCSDPNTPRRIGPRPSSVCFLRR